MLNQPNKIINSVVSFAAKRSILTFLDLRFNKIDFLKALLKASIQFCLINVAQNDQKHGKIIGFALERKKEKVLSRVGVESRGTLAR